MSRVNMNLVAVTMMLVVVSSVALADVPETINYQGRLTNHLGVPISGTYPMVFTIYDAESGGNVKWTESHTGVPINEGLFSVILGNGNPPKPILDTVFNERDRWLEIAVDGNVISPRTPFTSVAYAKATPWWTVIDSVLYTKRYWGIARGGVDNEIYGDSFQTVVNFGVESIAGDEDLISKYITISGGFDQWAAGSYSTIAGGSGNTIRGTSCAIGGGQGNWMNSDTHGSTIGGGSGNSIVHFLGDASTIGGGSGNNIDADEGGCTIGGGRSNNINYPGDKSTIAGGSGNSASHKYCSIGGGNGNSTEAIGGTISGGHSNTTQGIYAMIPGGSSNTAAGDYSFAAGRRAKANGLGSFVWADATDEDYTSYTDNQFAARANGGFLFNTGNPTQAFRVISDLWDVSYQYVNFQSNAVAASAADVLQLKVGAGSPDDFQFIECERGADFKFRVWGNGDVTADGVFTPGGADFAELIKVSSGYDSVEPCDVLIIDPDNPKSIIKSHEANSRLVAGIYSTKPGIVATSHDIDQLAYEDDYADSPYDDIDQSETDSRQVMELAASLDEIPLAVVGIVPCKVTSENGSIRPGDLLVTSNVPGHAMKNNEATTGTVIGKALGSLNNGTGIIDVLVTLQ